MPRVMIALIRDRPAAIDIHQAGSDVSRSIDGKLAHLRDGVRALHALEIECIRAGKAGIEFGGILKIRLAAGSPAGIEAHELQLVAVHQNKIEFGRCCGPVIGESHCAATVGPR